MTNEELRSLVLQCLRDRLHDQSQLQLSHLFNEIAELAKRRGSLFNGTHNAWLDNRGGRVELYPNLKGPASNIVWDLIIEGVLRPGDGRATSSEFDLPHIHITPFGRTVLEGHVSAYDPDGYLRHLRERVPTADAVIVKYIAESAETLRRNCLLSSTVTLGCASEQAFLLLLEAYGNGLNAADQSAFNRALSRVRGIKQQHQEFMKSYERILKPRLKAGISDSDWLTGLENALSFLFSYFRDMRNDAGHPTGLTLSRELVHSHLVVFPYYLRLIYDCIDWINMNKPL